MRTARTWCWIGLLLLGGCVQVEQTVVLNRDGSGRVIERIWTVDWVMQSAKRDPELAAVSDLFLEKNARERMAAYGDVTLVSHTVTNLGCHGIECRTVMAFSNINAITLPVALPGDTSQTERITFVLGNKQTWDGWDGWHYSVTRPLTISRQARYDGERRSMSLAEKERWARLLPAVREMVKGLRLVAKVEAFAPVNGKPSHTIYEVTDKDLVSGDALIDLFARGRMPEGGESQRRTYTVSIAERSESEETRSGQ